MLDDRVREVLARLESEDAEERARGVPASERSRQITRKTGEFLFALVTPQNECGVLEIGASRGYSTVWFAAGVRYFAGSVLSLEHDATKAEAWRRNIADAGLDEWADLLNGDAFETLPKIQDVFDVVFIDAEKEDYEALFQLAREKVEPGAVIVADNMLSHVETLGAYAAARQADPSLVSLTVPFERGLELSVVVH
jgi:predicted O-methyltransferase YrrM